MLIRDGIAVVWFRPLSRRIPPPPPAGNVWRRRRRKKIGAPPSQPKLIGAGGAGGAVPAWHLTSSITALLFMITLIIELVKSPS